MMIPFSLIQQAHDAGLCIVPPAQDGTKKPYPPGGGGWKAYQTQRPTLAVLQRWYDPRNGLTGAGVICGKVSCNLEAIDFDTRDAWVEYQQHAEMCGIAPLLSRILAGYGEESPRGAHLLYRCETIAGNTKLALAEDGKKATIETRGEGGYIIIAPSNGKVHPSGGDYRTTSGSLATIVEISPLERRDLWELAKSLTKFVPLTLPSNPLASSADPSNKPGNDFNRRANWPEVLEPHGWRRVATRGDKTYWRRPDKSEGISATTGYAGTDYLYVFSTSTPFESERGYTKFSAFAVLNCAGDFREATKALAARGYGEPMKWRERASVQILHSRDDLEITPEACGIDPDQDWKAALIQRRDGKTGDITYPCRVHNLMLILENDAQWKGRIRFDSFRQHIVIDQRELTDADAIELKAWLEKTWISSDVKTATVHEALETVATRHAFHPVTAWLRGLVWDQTARIDSFFSDYCGVDLTPYSIAVARSFFISAVARIMKPGCKVDTMLILEGAQGIGKSRLLLSLFSPEWHAEIMYEPGKPDFCQALRGKWCCEFGELAAMGKADNNRIKQVLTQTQDTYRKSYGHHSGTFPRQNIFAGTTNRDDWGIDETGLRRFLPITCAEINIDALEANRAQLWAEALSRFEAGERWWDIPDAAREQDRRYQTDSWEDLIIPYIKQRPTVTVTEVLSDALFIKPERHGRSEQTRVGAILRRLKWRIKQETTGSRGRYYVNPHLKQ